MEFPNKEASFKKQEGGGGFGPFARRLLASAGMGLALFALLALLAAAVCLKLDLPRERMGFAAIPLAAIAAFAAGYLNVRAQRKQGLVFGMLAAAALYLPLLLAALAVARGAPGANAALLLLAMLVGGAAGGIVSANRSGASNRKSAKQRKR